MRVRILLGAWLCLSLVLVAGLRAQQNDLRVRATLGSGVVKLGDVEQIVIEVNNARSAKIVEVPMVEGLTLGRISGPSLRESTVFSGGRRRTSRTLTFTVAVQPEREGEYVIPALRLSVDGDDVLTDPMTLTVVEDIQGDRFGFIEFVDLPAKVYEGEVFELTLRFGWQRQLSGINSADLKLPWWNNLSGVLEVDSGAPAIGRRAVTVNLNSEAQIEVFQLADMERDGSSFVTFVLQRRFVATRSGELEIPKSFLEYSEIESRGVFGGGRRAVQRYFVSADARTIEVLELPADERPLDFSNGVGSFNGRAQVNRWDVDVGDSIKLTVEWFGRGNLEFFDAPDLARLDAFDGFKSYGTSRDDFLGDRRVVTYDIAPLRSDVTSIPAVPLSIFDSETGRYAVVKTDPIEIRVRALEGASPLEVEGGSGRDEDIRDIQPAEGEVRRDSRPGAWTVLAAMFLTPLLWGALRAVARRGDDPDSPVVKRARRARKALQKDLRGARTASQQAHAVYDFLGARTRESGSAWVGRDPVEFLARGRKSGIAEADARALAELTEELDRAAYAGEDRPLDDARILSVCDRLLKAGV